MAGWSSAGLCCGGRFYAYFLSYKRINLQRQEILM
jgi:hypothetical protein